MFALPILAKPARLAAQLLEAKLDAALPLMHAVVPISNIAVLHQTNVSAVADRALNAHHQEPALLPSFKKALRNNIS